MFRCLKQRGDTIVEVLVAIGVISLVLTAAYVTANRSYLSMLDSQERTGALKLLEQQVEALRAYNAEQPPAGEAANYTRLTQAVANPNGFCMYEKPQVVNGKTYQGLAYATNSQSEPDANCRVDTTDKPVSATVQPAYVISIVRAIDSAGHPISISTDGTGTDFMVQISWDSVQRHSSDGKDHVQMEYGVYANAQ